MKKYLFLLLLCVHVSTFAQNIVVDNSTYSPQQLIEDILIDSSCIENVVVTNVIGGDFNNTDQSYGYFDATGTNFPFEQGVVLSTGRLANVPGPNDSLSDDDAPNWDGDNDLEIILNESNTLNATIIEFDFTARASQISFRYIFASEEYVENDPNTCRFSDLFGFLIKEQGTQNYDNIALVPGTQTPVKVTTVHPGIAGSCEPINEAYFDTFNGTVAPINFNGQTTILTAVKNVTPNQTYNVKLVIADEQNFRFDSAVFLEAGGFQLSTDLGPDLLIATGTALCDGQSYQLSVSEPGNSNTYKWFRNGTELIGQTNTILDINTPGIYSVEVTINNCVLFGEVIIEYTNTPTTASGSLTQCDANADGLTVYNLFDDDLIDAITLGDNSLLVSNFYLNEMNAEQNINEINNPQAFNNTNANQTVFARVENQFGCFAVAEVVLNTSNNTITTTRLELCDDDIRDGITNFDLSTSRTEIEMQSPLGSSVLFYPTQNDALLGINQIATSYENQIPFTETIYAQVNDSGACFAIVPIALAVYENPEIEENEDLIYCLNSFPNTLELEAGILNDVPSNYNYQWLFNGNDMFQNSSSIMVNETGIYTVIATNINGCSASRDITVFPSNIATIIDVSVVEASSNNTVTITVSGEGDYEYALDIGSIYQNSNVFTNVDPGFHTVFVRDKNGCGRVDEIISVLGFPKYFTPNGDSYNDTWKPLGVNEQFNSKIKIVIFDRFGKLIKEINPLGTGWDGSFNGKTLPNNDYWFTVTLTNGQEFHGHFALKR